MILRNPWGNARLKTFMLLFVLGALVGVVLLLRKTGWLDYLTFDYLKGNAASLKELVEREPWLAAGGYFVGYVAVAALSLPGATVLALGGGAIFGFWEAFVLVSFASSLGALLAFLFSRYFFAAWVERKFGDSIRPMQEGVRREGGLYLFSLRLVPIFPYFLVNLLMGLTPIRAWTFYWVSQVGMLAGTAAYVNAGTRLGEIGSLKDAVSPRLLLAFAFLGLLPVLSRQALKLLRAPRGS